jgi:hypothetical protein
MNGSTVTIVAVNADGSDGAVLGTDTTDSDGNFAAFIAPQTGAVRVEISGGTFASEEDNSTITPSDTISVLLPSVPSDTGGISVNPLSTFVDKQAVGTVVSGDYTTAISNATTSIQQSYGISSDPSFLNPDFTMTGVGTDAGRLALILGALINEDQLACPGGTGGLVSALAADLADGTFDGQSFGNPVTYCGGSLPASAGTTQFGDALSGQQGLTMASRAFTFGGTNNLLATNGVTPQDTAPDASMIVQGLVRTGPGGPLGFAPPPLPTMTSGRAEHTATLMPSTGNVLMAGGFGAGMAVLNTAELFNPATKTFTASTHTMLAHRQDHTATLLPNGKVLIAGGFNGSSNLNTAEVYDPIADTFTATTNPMSSARRFANAALLPTGKVLIVGGGVNTADLYDPSTNSFTASTHTMVIGRSNASATLLPKGRVLIAGGFNGADLSSAEVYDPDTDSFAATGNNMIVARAQATALLLPNGKVLVAGGIGTGGPLKSAELFDPAAGSGAGMFSAASTMIEARQMATSALLPNGNVLIVGGMGVSGPLTDGEVYDFVHDTFNAVAGNTSMPRANSTSTLLQNGAVLIAGGLGMGGSSNTTDICAPPPTMPPGP